MSLSCQQETHAPHKVCLIRSPVGAAEQRWRDVDAELFRRLEIDYQFELGGLHNWQFRGLFALQDATDLVVRTMPQRRADEQLRKIGDVSAAMYWSAADPTEYRSS